MAQYQVPDLDYDRWDSHRDMLIRTAVIHDNLHTFAEMGVFGKNSIGNERTYNAGYALTRYITQNWGDNALKDLADGMSKKSRVTINGSIKDVTGLSDNELYGQWKSHLENYYKTRLAKIAEHKVEGELVTTKGIGNIAPAWSPFDRSDASSPFPAMPIRSCSGSRITANGLIIPRSNLNVPAVVCPGTKNGLRKTYWPTR